VETQSLIEKGTELLLGFQELLLQTTLTLITPAGFMPERAFMNAHLTVWWSGANHQVYILLQKLKVQFSTELDKCFALSS